MKANSAGALLFAIITAFVLTMVASTFVLLTTNQYRIINSEVDRIRASYLIQAGMEWAIYNLYMNTSGWIPTGGDDSHTNHTLGTITVNVYDLPTTPPHPAFQNVSSYGIEVITTY